MARQSDDPQAVDPCDYMILAYDMIEAIPCGRPTGHDDTIAMVSGGHNITPLHGDRPVKRWKQIKQWVIEG